MLPSTAAWSSPCCVQVQAGPNVVDDRFFRTRTAGCDPVAADDRKSERERLAVRDEVRGASLEMERARAPTNSAIAVSTPPTAGEGESRTLGQEGQDVQASVRAEPSEDEAFTLCHRHVPSHCRTPVQVRGRFLPATVARRVTTRRRTAVDLAQAFRAMITGAAPRAAAPSVNRALRRLLGGPSPSDRIGQPWRTYRTCESACEGSSAQPARPSRSGPGASR